jgi:acid stress chaperone HdeB
MQFRLTFVIVFAALATGGSSVQSKELDNRTITCRVFLASGQANMAALISWLRGYHAGKTGVIPYQSPDPYGGRLGFYCKQNPDANLIDASEQILMTIDHGIRPGELPHS